MERRFISASKQSEGHLRAGSGQRPCGKRMLCQHLFVTEQLTPPLHFQRYGISMRGGKVLKLKMATIKTLLSPAQQQNPGKAGKRQCLRHVSQPAATVLVSL